MSKTFPLNIGPGELRELNRAYPSRYPFLLQSTAQTGALGRYDILFAFPGESLVLDGTHGLSGKKLHGQDQFLQALDTWWSSEQLPGSAGSLPFTGGWFLYLAYELAAEIEPGLNLRNDPLLPVAFAVRCPAAVIYDHEGGCAHFVAETDDSEQRDAIHTDLAQLPARPGNERILVKRISEDEPTDFTNAVSLAKKYISAGDVYQANLSRQWSIELDAQNGGAALYRGLCEANPAPFAGIAHWQDTTIISSSPERLLESRDGIVSTRPIAGTRPRGSSDEADDDLSSELIAHPKERAEHIMLIDLERNDLGRVCEAGSVEVDEMMILESYAHVHHIVSNVRGKLRDDVSPGDAIAAVFPGGTITGCPKVRCMEIIDELENAPRGAYTGSFGYLNRDGSMDLNILIRTMVLSGNELTFRAGAGIVADSIPDGELDETRAKAEGLLRAIHHD